MILPESISDCANQALDALRKQCGKNIYPDIDGAQLLSLRARLMQFKSATQISANGSCHLLLTEDKQWIALNLSRPSDWELLPALFKHSKNIDAWQQVTTLVKKSLAADLIEQGRNLGLPIALAEQNRSLRPANYFDIVYHGENQKANRANNTQARVLDLSSLWAGPLCSQLLQQSGAQVIKVESKQRPDSMQFNTLKGGKEFFEWLNRGKALRVLDFTQVEAIQTLKKLITQSDIVIEGSRPRVLQQWGIDAEAMVKQQAGLIWVSITGYGRQEPEANWVAFGDDAAINAGLFYMVDNKPAFIGDAIADPLTGLHAALVAQQYYRQGRSALIDINLCNVSRYCKPFTL